MKIFTCVLLVFLIFNSCKKELNDDHLFRSRYEKELANDNVNDSIFLNLRLKMSRDEYYEALLKLLVKGEINRDHSYYAELMLNNDSYKEQSRVNLYPEFYKDSLIKLDLTINNNSSKLSRESVSILRVNELVNILKEKYGVFAPRKDVFDNYEYYNINGNRLIIVSQGVLSDNQIIYSDIRLTHLKDSLENKEINNRKEKQKDIF